MKQGASNIPALYHYVYDADRIPRILEDGALRPGSEVEGTGEEYDKRPAAYRREDGVVYLTPHDIQDPEVKARFRVPPSDENMEVVLKRKRYPLSKLAELMSKIPDAQARYDKYGTRRYRQLLQVLHKGPVPVSETDLERLGGGSAVPAGTVLITGLPGSGKTTLAERRAKETGLPAVHLDDLKPQRGSRFAGTAEALRYLSGMKKPAVVEGTSILGMKPEEYSGADLEFLDVPWNTLVDRLVVRGIQDEDGSFLQGEKNRDAIEAWLETIKPAADRFRKEHVRKTASSSIAASLGRLLYGKRP